MAIDSGNGDILTVRLEYVLGTDVGYNVLHYRIINMIENASGLPPATNVPFSEIADTIGQAVYEYFDGPWSTVASVSAVFTGVTVQDVSPAPRSRPFTYLPVAPQAGLVAGDALPLQDSLTIEKQTAYGQRWGIGRVFVFGLPEASQAGGNIVIGARADLVSLAGFFKDGIAWNGATYSGSIQPVLYQEIKTGHPPVGTGVWRTTGLINAEIKSWVLKSQKRRRPGKGI